MREEKEGRGEKRRVERHTAHPPGHNDAQALKVGRVCEDSNIAPVRIGGDHYLAPADQPVGVAYRAECFTKRVSSGEEVQVKVQHPC